MLKNFIDDVFTAIKLLTQIPIPQKSYDKQGRSVWAYSLPGIIWAITIWSITKLLTFIGMPIDLAITIGLSSGILLTGAIHEDGLADSADGLLGGNDQQSRLRIMKDSSLGTFGVSALIISLVLRWSLFYNLFLADCMLGSLIIAGMISRAVLPFMMLRIPHARKDGLSFDVGIPKKSPAILGFSMAVIFSVTVGGLYGLCAVVVSLTAAFFFALYSSHKIGGQTGDTLGATNIITELTILFVLVYLNS